MSEIRDEFRMDARALSILGQSVRRLVEDDGNIELHSTRLWPEDLCKAASRYPSHCWDPSQEQTESWMKDIQTLKSVENGLKLLAENLSNVINMSRTVISRAARKYGLARLPDEIMLLIFEQVLRSHEDPFTGSPIVIHNLSLVSKRFRELVLTCAELWSYLDLDKCPDHVVDLFIGRSKTKSLSVKFGCSARAERNILRALECHVERWHYLEVDFDYSRDSLNLPSVTFPTAKTLVLIIRDCNSSDPRAWPTWIFPRVQSLELRIGFPPTNALRYECLQSFTYKANRYTGSFGGNDFVEGLTTFLRPALWLSTLHLDVSFIDIDEFDVEYLVELPSVRIFSMSNWRDGDIWRFSFAFEPEPMPQDTFAKLIRVLKMPNVRDVSISMIILDSPVFYMSDWLPLVFPHGEMHSVSSVTLRILDLPIVERVPGHTIIGVEGLLTHFPALKRLDLDTGSCEITVGEGEALKGAHSDLRSLRVNFNGEFHRRFLEVLEFMAKHCDLLEVEIQSKTDFDSDLFKHMFDGISVRWKHG